MTHRVLYLLRHAEAESTPSGGGHDADRALSAHGVEQAQNVGEHLRAAEPGVQRIIRSDAVRTAETAAQLALDVPIEVSSAIYHAGGATIRDAIVGVPSEVECLLVVGHAPGIPAAVHLLADRGRSDDQALSLVDTWYPTATLSRLEFDGEWSDLADGREEFAALTAVFRG